MKIIFEGDEVKDVLLNGVNASIPLGSNQKIVDVDYKVSRGENTQDTLTIVVSKTNEEENITVTEPTTLVAKPTVTKREPRAINPEPQKDVAEEVIEPVKKASKGLFQIKA